LLLPPEAKSDIAFSLFPGAAVSRAGFFLTGLGK
jgi:hypothetical protein